MKVSAAVLLAALSIALGPAHAAGQAQYPVNRWSVEGMRPNRVVRPGDLYIKPPVRTYRKAKPIPRPELESSPRYGAPDPALERIPPT